MVVKREQYVDSLVGSMHNGLIKVVTTGLLQETARLLQNSVLNIYKP